MRGARDDAASPWLWLGRKGRLTDSGISQMVKQRGEAAGVALHPHMLRHYYAHTQLSRGMSEGDLMTLAGWRSREMLSRYAAASRTDRALPVRSDPTRDRHAFLSADPPRAHPRDGGRRSRLARYRRIRSRLGCLSPAAIGESVSGGD
jgi:hypothetical protein